jgi:hypothetical protein
VTTQLQLIIIIIIIIIIFVYTQLFIGSWDNVVGMVTKLRPGRSGLLILTEARDILFLQIVQTGSEVYPISFSVGVDGAFRGGRAPEV